MSNLGTQLRTTKVFSAREQDFTVSVTLYGVDETNSRTETLDTISPASRFTKGVKYIRACGCGTKGKWKEDEPRISNREQTLPPPVERREKLPTDSGGGKRGGDGRNWRRTQLAGGDRRNRSIKMDKCSEVFG